jgi:general L-amino acid transport system permease protein
MRRPSADGQRRGRWFYDRRLRDVAAQALTVLLLGAALAFCVDNAATNLQRAGIASGFAFLERPAGFSIGFRLIDFTPRDTYARAFLVGLLNTLLTAGLGIAVSTVFGFLLGIARLSRNWLLATSAALYVGTIRNLPLLLQLLFWYIAVLTPLPQPKGALSVLGLTYLSNRGLVLPRPEFGAGSGGMLLAILLAAVAAGAVAWWARRHRMRTGQGFPTLLVGAAILLALPLGAGLALHPELGWEVPVLQGFNFAGGVRVPPEFVALFLALTLYASAFIAETVRAGILAVPAGQIEAARALGLPPRRVLRFVTVPQALRVIIPPLTGQHLNLLKNSSLAVVIGFPDLVAVFAGTTLNQTGQAIEVIAITMAVYLAISLAVSAAMNLWNWAVTPPAR